MDKIYCELCENFVNDDEIIEISFSDGHDCIICFECMNKIEEERISRINAL